MALWMPLQYNHRVNVRTGFQEKSRCWPAFNRMTAIIFQKQPWIRSPLLVCIPLPGFAISFPTILLTVSGVRGVGVTTLAALLWGAPIKVLPWLLPSFAEGKHQGLTTFQRGTISPDDFKSVRDTASKKLLLQNAFNREPGNLLWMASCVPPAKVKRSLCFTSHAKPDVASPLTWRKGLPPPVVIYNEGESTYVQRKKQNQVKDVMWLNYHLKASVCVCVCWGRGS